MAENRRMVCSSSDFLRIFAYLIVLSNGITTFLTEMNTPSLYDLYQAYPHITTDSRCCPQDSIFFALKGENFNGNQFAAQALANGCAMAVVDEKSAVVAGDARYVLVEDALAVLQQLAQHHRRQFKGTVLEITGTNGKTTTKELVAAVLSQKYKVLATKGNLNNHIGVPKTLLELRPEHEMAVIETGANHPGEIAFLANLAEPDFGLITNVGKAHLEGFGSFQGVIKTKGELYDYLRTKPNGKVFLNTDNPYLEDIVGDLPAVGYGVAGGEGNYVEGEIDGCHPFLTLRWRVTDGGEWHKVKTHLIGAYNFQNVLAAVCVGKYFGVEDAAIDRALEGYFPKNDRSELRVTAFNQLIVDAYNANPTSMTAAVENFGQIRADHKMVILGEMRELGAASEEEHQKIVDLLKRQDCYEAVWLVGDLFRKAHHNFRTFANVEDVKRELSEHPVRDKLILIKGSNGTKLFQLPEYL